MHSIIAPAAGPRLHVMGDVIRMLASSEETGGAYEIFELEGPEGSGPPPHAHPWTESYLVIDGEADVFVEGTKQRATLGSFVHIPAGTKHSYRIATKSAKFVVVTSPSGAKNFFTEIDAETGGSCEDVAKIMAVATKHGVK